MCFHGFNGLIKERYMVYSINDVVVFGKAFAVPSYPIPVIKDIFGNDVVRYVAVDEADNNRNRDSTINGLGCQIIRNMELGKSILAKFREWVYKKNAELGISGNGVELLQSFYLIESALLAGMLSEASYLIANTIPDTDIVTAECKSKFSQACTSADHII